MLKSPIYITAISSISALGSSSEEIWHSYKSEKHNLSKVNIGEQSIWAAPLPKGIAKEVDELRRSNDKYQNLDSSVLFAIYTARKAIKATGWKYDDVFGVNIGSSRGATTLFEKYHQEYLETKSTATLTSPTTTLGNISSWVAHDLGSNGPEISHSITCSTSLHAILNAVAWLQSGLAEKFLVGGSEAPLTPFTIAQMQALKIYAKHNSDNQSVHSKNGKVQNVEEYPNMALDFDKKENSMVLGESAAMACLDKSKAENTLAEIVGIGYATEPLQHNVSISSDAKCFQDSMKMATEGIQRDLVDVVVMHAPGTVKGDVSEFNAIKEVFGENLPALTSNKWKTGHTFGASGMLSVELAILMLNNKEFVPVPYLPQPHPKKINYIMVNAVGFGGNAVSILLKKANSK